MIPVPAQIIVQDSSPNLQQPAHRPIRNLLLTTKAYQATEAIQSIMPRLVHRDQLRLIVMSNGALAIKEELDPIFSLPVLSRETTAMTPSTTNATKSDLPTRNYRQSPQWIMAMTTHGVYQDPPPDQDLYYLHHVGNGRTLVGGMPENGMTQIWDQSGLNCQSISPAAMQVVLWQKLAANAVCNPLTTLWKIPNGQLWDQPSFRSILTQLLQEVSNVSQALEQPENNRSHHPVDLQQLTPQALRAFVEQVIHDNQTNKSSMWYDVEHGRRTEVDYLNGYIVRKGRELGIDCRANEELLFQIHSLSDNSIRDKEDRTEREESQKE